MEIGWEETDSNLVLEMELRVTGSQGETSRIRFLSVDAQASWARLPRTRGVDGEGEEAPRTEGCFRPGMARAPLRGTPPFRVELDSLFDGKVIGKADTTLEGGSSKDEKKDLPVTPPRLHAAPPVPDGFFPIGIFSMDPWTG